MTSEGTVGWWCRSWMIEVTRWLQVCVGWEEDEEK